MHNWYMMHNVLIRYGQLNHYDNKTFCLFLTAVDDDTNNRIIQTDSGRNTPVGQPNKIKQPKKNRKQTTTEVIRFTPAVASRALRSVIDTGKAVYNVYTFHYLN